MPTLLGCCEFQHLLDPRGIWSTSTRWGLLQKSSQVTQTPTEAGSSSYSLVVIPGAQDGKKSFGYSQEKSHVIWKMYGNRREVEFSMGFEDAAGSKTDY